MNTKIIIILLMLLGISHVAIAIPPQADRAVARYMRAMFAGNITDMRGEMGQRYAKKHKRHLNNSRYREELADNYRNAKYEILETKILSDKLLQLSIQVWYGRGEYQFMQLILENVAQNPNAKPRYKILERIDDPVFDR